jgi:hypothetical protein
MQRGIVTHTINKATHRLIHMVVLMQQVLRIQLHHHILNIPNNKLIRNIHTDRQVQSMQMNIILTMVTVLLIQHRMSMQTPMVCYLNFAIVISYFLFISRTVYGSGGAYDYNSYYTSGGAGVSGSIVDNATGQQGNKSPNDTNNYDRDNHYGKAKTSIIPSPTYHTYSIS